MIDIYNNGEVILSVAANDYSYRSREIMGEDMVSLHFSLPVMRDIPVGAYIAFQGTRYTLRDKQDITIRNTRNIEYELRLTAESALLDRYILRNPVDRRVRFELVGTAKEHAQMIADNLMQRDVNAAWAVTADEGEARLINYSEVTLREALALIAEEFGTEYEVVTESGGSTIMIGRVSYNEENPLPMKYGKGNGLLSGVKRSTTDKGGVSRLYVQGGERNIDPSRYGSRQLLLPKDAIIGCDGKHCEGEEGYKAGQARLYRTDEDGYSVEGISHMERSGREACLDESETYPCRDEVVAEVLMAKEGEPTLVDIVFESNVNYAQQQIRGERPSIIFQTGELAGKEFGLNTDKDGNLLVTEVSAGRWRVELVAEEIDGVTMPDLSTAFKPVEGNKFRVFGIMLPDQYISDAESKTGAEWDMLRVAVKWLYDHEQVFFSYSCEVDSLWASKRADIWSFLRPGGYVRLTDERFLVGNENVRITGLKQSINDQYKIELNLSSGTVSGGVSAVIRRQEGSDVAIEATRRAVMEYTKRRFRDAQETMEMLAEAFSDTFTGGVNPVTVQTMSVLLGDESLQYDFHGAGGLAMTPAVNWDNAQRKLTVDVSDTHGWLSHKTLGITDITSGRNPSSYKRWAVVDTEVYGPEAGAGFEASKPYYVYCKCCKEGENNVNYPVEWVLTETAKPMDDGQPHGYYWLMYGILSSEYDGERSLVPMYGFTEILPGRITTNTISDPSGNLVIDLANGTIKGPVTFTSGSSGLENIAEFASLQYEVDALKNQRDGVVVNWFGEYTPEADNAPASVWTAEQKANHVGDTFTDTRAASVTNTGGMSWRWEEIGEGEYGWVEITDEQTMQALLKRGREISAADGKSRTFAEQPEPPYEVGDLWIRNKEIWQCRNAKAVGEMYAESDWTKATDYTTEAMYQAYVDELNAINELVEKADRDITAMKQKLDKIDDDGLVSPDEQKILAQMLADMRAEVAEYWKQAQDYGLTEAEVWTAYNDAAADAIDSLVYHTTRQNVGGVEDEYIPIDAVKWAKIELYYAPKMAFLTEIAKSAKLLAQDAKQLAQEANETAKVAYYEAQSAREAATGVQSYLDGALDDDILDLSEKRALEALMTSLDKQHREMDTAARALMANPFLEEDKRVRMELLLSNPSGEGADGYGAQELYDNVVSAMAELVALLEEERTAGYEARLAERKAAVNTAIDQYEAKVDVIILYTSECNTSIQGLLKGLIDSLNQDMSEVQGAINTLNDDGQFSLLEKRTLRMTMQAITSSKQPLTDNEVEQNAASDFPIYFGSFHDAYKGARSRELKMTDGRNAWEALYAVYDALTDYLIVESELYSVNGATAVGLDFRDELSRLFREYYEVEEYIRQNAPLSDYQYLRDLFKGGHTSQVEGGVIITNIVGVTELGHSETERRVVAGLNGSEVLGADSEHGKLMLFAGSAGATDAEVREAKTRIYEDGHIVAESGQFGGFLRVRFNPINGGGSDYDPVTQMYTLNKDMNIDFTPETRAGATGGIGRVVNLQLPTGIEWAGAEINLYEYPAARTRMDAYARVFCDTGIFVRSANDTYNLSVASQIDMAAGWMKLIAVPYSATGAATQVQWMVTGAQCAMYEAYADDGSDIALMY